MAAYLNEIKTQSTIESSKIEDIVQLLCSKLDQNSSYFWSRITHLTTKCETHKTRISQFDAEWEVERKEIIKQNVQDKDARGLFQSKVAGSISSLINSSKIDAMGAWSEETEVR